jgi:hypothetical protein
MKNPLKRLLALVLPLAVAGMYGPRLWAHFGGAAGGEGPGSSADLALPFPEELPTGGAAEPGTSAPDAPTPGSLSPSDVAALVAALRGLDGAAGATPSATQGAIPQPPESRGEQAAAAVPADPLAAGQSTEWWLAEHPLRGVLIGPGDARALLGSHLVRVGDELNQGRVRVAAIEPGGVRLHLDGRPRQLALPEFRAREGQSQVSVDRAVLPSAEPLPPSTLDLGTLE